MEYVKLTKKSDFIILCNEYSDFFAEFKGIPPQCNIKHHINLLNHRKALPNHDSIGLVKLNR